MEYDFQELTFDELSSAKVKQLYTYWNKKRGNRVYPSLADINLSEIPEIEPHLAFAEVHYSPFKIKCVWVGRQMIQYYKRDFTGEWLHEIFSGGMLRYIEVLHRIAMTHPLPLLGREELPGEAVCEWGIFPLSDNGTIINCNLVIEDQE